MAATVTIAELNGPDMTPATTGSITNSNMGSTDAVNLVAADYPITAGQNSYEKWQKYLVTAMGGSSKVKTLKVWTSAVLAAGATMYTSATVDVGYVCPTPYAAPVATASTAATFTIANATPASGNVGINGDLGGEITDVDESDFVVFQIKTSTDATAGTSVTMNYQYDEVA